MKKGETKGGNICVIGPRAAGKTTYLSALAYWQDVKNKNIKINPIGAASKKLKDDAENKIRQGTAVKPTLIGEKIKSVNDLPLYQFSIESQRMGGLKNTKIELVVRDYPGEIFDELAEGNFKPLHQEFLNLCFIPDMVGCLVLLHEWEMGRDDHYNRGFERFIALMDKNSRLADLRLAVAMSKCERGELWPGRLEPEIDIFREHLPRTTETLRNGVPKQNLRFYALSTFGVISRNDPRPNRKDEPLGSKGSALKDGDPKKWQPHGMMSPLYWLSGS